MHSKTFIGLLNDLLQENKSPFHCTEIQFSRFRAHENEGGAWYIKAVLKHKVHGFGQFPGWYYLYGYMRLKEYGSELKAGRKLAIKKETFGGYGEHITTE